MYYADAITGNIMNSITEYFKKEKKRLIKFVNKKLKRFSIMEPEDVLQDVFCKIISGGYKYEDIQNMDSFVFSSLRNKIYDVYRKKYDEISTYQMVDGQEIDILDTVSTSEDIVQTFHKKEIMSSIFQALESLSDEYKSVWIAYHVDGKSVSQIAVELDIPPGTVLSRKFRANEKLRNILGTEIL